MAKEAVEAKARKSSKGVFVIQQKDTLGDGPGWTDLDMTVKRGEGEPADLDSTAACKKYISDNKLEGAFRVINVRATFTTKTETVKKVTFE